MLLSKADVSVVYDCALFADPDCEANRASMAGSSTSLLPFAFSVKVIGTKAPFSGCFAFSFSKGNRLYKACSAVVCVR